MRHKNWTRDELLRRRWMPALVLFLVAVIYVEVRFYSTTSPSSNQREVAQSFAASK